MTFKQLFGDKKPVIGMLHLKRDAKKSMMERLRDEVICYCNAWNPDKRVDAVLVENYFGTAEDCEQALAYLQENYSDRLIYGVNILGDYKKAFELSAKYGAKFIQIDSVCGHLSPDEEADFVRDLQRLRANSDAVVLGGVRFKYQPVRSGRSLEVDLWLGRERCDAIVVTGEGTGKATPLDKVDHFRRILGDFPLIVGAGVTIDTVGQTFSRADGAIVGSYFKTGHRDMGEVDFQTICKFMDRKRWLASADRMPVEEMERMYQAVMQSLDMDRNNLYRLVNAPDENAPAPWEQYLKNTTYSMGDVGYVLASLLFGMGIWPGWHVVGDLLPITHAGWEERPGGPYYTGLALRINGKCFAGRDPVLYYADDFSTMEVYEKHWDLAAVEANSRGVYDLHAVKLPESGEGALMQHEHRADAVLAFRLKPGYDEYVLVTERSGEFDCGAGEVLNGDFSRLCPLYLDDFIMK